jgi:hypothetical protein
MPLFRSPPGYSSFSPLSRRALTTIIIELVDVIQLGDHALDIARAFRADVFCNIEHENLRHHG